MPLSGNFETFDLNSIFQLLRDDQKTGVLKVKNEDQEIRIYMKNGEIIRSRSCALESDMIFTAWRKAVR